MDNCINLGSRKRFFELGRRRTMVALLEKKENVYILLREEIG
jgi:hypothetical protein